MHFITVKLVVYKAQGQWSPAEEARIVIYKIVEELQRKSKMNFVLGLYAYFGNRRYYWFV